MLQNIFAIVLAAGKSTRFVGPESKLLTPLCGKALILYPLKLLEDLGINKCFVLGHKAAIIQKLILKKATSPINFALQLEQLGTGHAVARSKQEWQGNQILILNGDMPLISPQLIKNLIAIHIQKNATVSLIAFEATDPGCYGRVIVDNNRSSESLCAYSPRCVRDDNDNEHYLTQPSAGEEPLGQRAEPLCCKSQKKSNNTIEIIEFKDCTDAQKSINLVNAGIYLIDRTFLETQISNLNSHNAAQEFYLTDLIGIASAQKAKVVVSRAPEAEVLGINTLEDFAAVEKILIKNYTKTPVKKAYEEF